MSIENQISSSKQVCVFYSQVLSMKKYIFLFRVLKKLVLMAGLGSVNGQATTSTSGLHGTLNFSSRTSSCSIKMPLIVENEHEALQPNCIKSRNMGNENGITKCYMPSFTNDYWDNSTFSAPKNATNKGEFMFSTSNALETQVHKIIVWIFILTNWPFVKTILIYA